MLLSNVGTGMAVLRCAPFGACSGCLTAKTACRIHCTDVAGASGARGECGFASDHAFQMIVGTSDREICDLLDQHNACTLDACLCSICMRIPFRSVHRDMNQVPLESLLYKKNYQESVLILCKTRKVFADYVQR